MGRSKRGILGTVLFHGIILVIVIFFGFIEPFPPPEEEGILINFGTEESGAGDREPAVSEAVQETPPPPKEEARPEQEEAKPAETKEEILAQDFEEAPAVKTRKTETKKEVKEVPVEEKPVVKKETPPPPKEEPPKVVEKALYHGRGSADESSKSEGITEGTGNQGNPSGSPDSDNYLNGLSSGKGGIDFSLAGRNPISLPKPEYNVQEAGKVVVRIRVNREGIVTYAEAGVKGTNTLNKELIEAARKAALKALFNRSSPDAADTQIGTITYHFVLQ